MTKPATVECNDEFLTNFFIQSDCFEIKKTLIQLEENEPGKSKLT